MTYPPSGAPGGYPGQGPHQPQPGPGGYGPPHGHGGGMKLSLTQILALVAGGLGVLNLFLGFAPVGGNSGFYESFFGWVPALLAIGGLLQAPAFLPGDTKPGIAPAAVTLGAALGFLFTVFAFGGSLAAGGVMVLIFGILQAGAAVAAYLFESGLVKPPAPNPYGPPPGGGYQPPPPGFPPSGQFPAQQPGQPAQPTTQMGQPGQFGTPPQPGQQTQFAPQQGQFGAPGTPPGGYPQQPQG